MKTSLPRFSRRFAGGALLVSSLALAGCESDPVETEEPAQQTSIAEVASERSDLNTFVDALEAADLTATFAGEGEFTVFAPSDSAFAALPDGALETLIADPSALGEVLQFHVVAGVLDSSAVVASSSLTTISGEELTVTVDGDIVRINDAAIQEVDIAASNGVIHIIDAVLLPAEEEPAEANTIIDVAGEAGNFTTLLAAVDAAGLTATLDDEEAEFTVFAPTDAAFDSLPEGTVDALLADTDALTELLLFHVAGEALAAADVLGLASIATLAGIDADVDASATPPTIAGAPISVTDIQTDNGIIHVLDAVMTIPEVVEPETRSIIDVAAEAGSFTTLLAAVEAAGLTDTLADLDAEFTVFAPTDAAFAALPEGTVEALLADTEALTELLLFHVASGSLSAEVVLASPFISTVAGIDASVDADATPPTIAGAPISATDVAADNGVIHIVDAVMMLPVIEPSFESVIDVAKEAGSYNTLLAAIEAAGLTETLSNPDASFTVFAPTDAAFAALPEGAVEALLADTERLTELLLFHVSGEVLDAEAVLGSFFVSTLSGFEATVDATATPPTVGSAPIGATDIMADNGIIHSLDAVMTIEHPKSVLEIAAEAGGFSTVLAAIEAAGLTEALSDLDTFFTLFAPTDEAFAALPEGVLDELLADTDALADLLLFHVAGEPYTAAEVLALDAIPTLAGLDAVVDASSDPPTIAGAPISATDIAANNGIIHVLDAVMTPPRTETIIDVATENGSFTTLLAAVEAAGLTDTLADPEALFTVFAPTDEAFAALPAGTVDALLADIPALTDILLYHVVGQELIADDVLAREAVETLLGIDAGITTNDAGAFIGGAQIVLTDIPTANGVIHVIDAVLIPPGDIVDVLSADPRFSTLVAAVGAASLDLALVQPGPYTAFAPTNAAFEALPEGTVDALLADIPALTDILLFHVVSGKYYAGDVVAESSLTTLQGANAEITLDAGARIEGALISQTNIVTENGVIHVIDAVILP